MQNPMIETGHQMVGFVGFGRQAALVEIGGQRVVAGAREAVGDTADLVVEAPPLLNHHDPRPALPRRRQIGLGLAPIGALKIDHRTHRTVLPIS